MIYWIAVALIYAPELNLNLILFLTTLICCIVSIYMSYKRYHLFAKTFPVFIYILSMIGHLLLIGNIYNHHLLFTPALVLSVFMFKKNEKLYEYCICFFCISLFIYFEFFHSNSINMLNYSSEVSFIVRTSTVCTIFFSIISVTIYAGANSLQVETSLNEERRKSENLLLNVLPDSIVHRLKYDSNNIADNFANVTILFADIVGFTEFSKKIPPEKLVALLNEVFSKFDDLASKYKLEKINTIGDCYMVASGLPEENEDHASRITNFALDILEAIKDFNIGKEIPFQIRIGINSGPVVAGVIGKKKFIYDLWGDTVNTASRMESNGKAGQIQITENTFGIIKNQFKIISRGMIDVKGKGRMKTYLVKKRILVQ